MQPGIVHLEFYGSSKFLSHAIYPGKFQVSADRIPNMEFEASQVMPECAIHG